MIKSYPKLDELKKRQKRVAEHMSSSPSSIIASKKPRLDIEDDEEEEEEEEEEGGVEVHHKKHTDLAIDITEQYVVERLSPEMTVQLVMVFMVSINNVEF